MIKRRLNFGRKGSDGVETTTSKEERIEWEMRPGGMLVQKRTQNSESPTPNLRVRVAYGAVRYEISVSSQATFGELKKLLQAESGLPPTEQRLIFREKERENGEYLDRCGVKHRSKVILIDDPASKERRIIEMRRIAKIRAAHNKINDVCTEIDKLTEQVCAIEKSIANGNKVAEVQITTLIEMLMRQAVKLGTLNFAEGDDTCALKDFQGKRVQKCVETLDILKASNAAAIKPVVVTTKWETFDHYHPPTTTNHWEYFD